MPTEKLFSSLSYTYMALSFPIKDVDSKRIIKKLSANK